jgi:uncharacterized protein YqjF (DUF2071 family)
LETISAFAPRSIERPAMRQVWRELTFLHWRYDPRTISSLLPLGLRLDTFDGSAWVGLVPFMLAGVQPRGFPALPWISAFPETNVRTYVRGANGERGVWFFTLEADRLAAVMLARVWYHLPYRWAAMRVERQGSTIEYRSQRSRLFGRGNTAIGVEIGTAMQATALENFLTARFRLYTAVRGRIAYAQIEHAPWPLRYASVKSLEEDLIQNSGVPAPEGEPIVHYSEELFVKAEALQWVK